MKVGLLCEGDIDLELVPALLHRISRQRAGIRWPLSVSDVVEEVKLRKGGFGQVIKALGRLLQLIGERPFSQYDCFVIVVDAKSRDAREKIRRRIRGDYRFVLGIAVQEIEAWWLADRRNTLEWIDLEEGHPAGLRYWAHAYNPERDQAPKVTLDELTQESPRLRSRYGDGNTELAGEFAALWRDRAELDQMEIHCPRGFAPFCGKAAGTFRRLQPARARRSRRGSH